MSEMATTVEQSHHFFELAATIMPIVLFGSVLARAFKPPNRCDRHRWYHGPLAFGITAYVGFVATMEALAVAAAIYGGPERVIRFLVSCALVMGVFGFGLAITVPWAVRFWQKRRMHWLATIIFGIAVFLLSFAWGSVKVLSLANNGSLGTAAASELGRAQNAVHRAELAWLRAEISARADHRISPLERRETAILRDEKQTAEKELKALEQR